MELLMVIMGCFIGILITIVGSIINKTKSRKLNNKYNKKNLSIDYNNKINNKFMKKYPDINMLQSVLYKQVNSVNEFKTNLNLTKPLINQPYTKFLVQYINQQCNNNKQYKYNRLWAKQSNPIIKRLLNQFEGIYEDEPINVLKTQILPPLQKKLDILARKAPFKNNSEILQYQNRIQTIQKLSDKKLSIKLIQTGYKQTLMELANNDFNQSDAIYMWNQQLRQSLEQASNLKTKLLLISMNIQIANLSQWLKLPINEDDLFKENIQIVDQLKDEVSNENDRNTINVVTKRFNQYYNQYQKHGQSELNMNTFDFYVDANQALEIDIKAYLIKYPFESVNTKLQ